MQFSVKRASRGGVYAGMIFGAVMMGIQSGPNPFGLLTGLFFGCAIGLPLTFAQLAAALFVHLLSLAGQVMIQLFLFFTASAGLYWLILSMLDEWLRGMGGLLRNEGALLDHALFFAAGSACSLVAMALWKRDPR